VQDGAQRRREGAQGDARAKDALAAGLSHANAAVRASARAALEKLRMAVPEAKPAATTPSPGDVAEARTVPLLAIVRTDRGDFTIDLLGPVAPRNVAAFAHLARKDFYDGLTFHRDVPDFVIQGGDPRGDGYGGPDFTVRDEPTLLLPYERGAVGVALAGKDTGGSQLFVTHSLQPHLDGRYTLIGKVVEGMDVVDTLLPGDRIQDVRIERAGAVVR
jgi:cyclophilin family peptidyl-prolyl cis-trans isomerase